MRIFLMTLLVSIVASIVFWNFGLARLIWPGHPLLATTLMAMGCGIGVQKTMTWQRDHERTQKPPQARH
jgi:hypothetical protein